MAENHYVDPKDQHIAAEGVADHSELTTAYIDAKNEPLGPWMGEQERQASFEEERNKLTKGLRKSVVPIGIFLGLPVVFGILIGQIALTGVDPQDPNAMAYVIGMIFAAGIALALTLGLFRWVGHTFQNHALRALPITLTVLGSLVFLIQKIFDYTNESISGIPGYATALGALIIISIIISTITIFAWTAPKLPAVIKLFVLLLFFGASVGIHYLL